MTINAKCVNAKKHISRKGLAMLIRVNLRLNRRLKTASTQAKPTLWLTPRYAIGKLNDRLRGFQILDFS